MKATIYILPLFLALSGFVNLAHGSSLAHGLIPNNIESDSTEDVMAYMLENNGEPAYATQMTALDDPNISTTGVTFDNSIAPVPIPAAAWLFGSALIGFVGFARRRSV